jgi:uncharacterized RDD family membrane protein YckC
MAVQPDHVGRRDDDAKVVGLVPRIGARLIDAVALAAVGVTLGARLGFGVDWLVIQTVLVFAYFVVCDVTLGTTAGKRLLGLRVIGPQGGTPTVKEAAIRETFTLLGAIPFAGPLLALVAWIVIIVTINASPTKQGKHDELAGGTHIVRA